MKKIYFTRTLLALLALGMFLSGTAYALSGPYTINATGSEGGTIQPSGLVGVAAGANQTFIMTPDPSQLDCWGSGKLYVVWNVTVDGQVVGSDPLASSKPVFYNFTDVEQDHSIHAEFTYALINARPIARFAADPTSGPVPLNVNFSQVLVSNNTGVLWSFGDNTTSTEGNPVHTYTSPGVYDVTFTIFCNNSSYASQPLPITVLPPPVANGTLYIASSPTNATILINGTDYGRTNRVVNVPAGVRNLTLTKPGYQAKTLLVDVPAGGSKILAPITLMKGGPVPPGATGTLYVTSYPTGATILIDGIVRGTTDGFVNNVPAGVQNLTLTRTGYQAKTVPVDVPAGGTKILAPITLTKGGGPGGVENLQAAVDAASDGDTLILKAGTYYDNVVINKSLTIIGAGPGLTIINGDTGEDVVEGGVINITRPYPHLSYAPNVTLIGMTITEGDADYGGGIFNDGGNLTLSQVSITNSTASLSGGGLYNEEGMVIMTETSLKENTAKVGGGVMNDGSTLIMNSGSSLAGNTAQIGGGLNNVQGTVIMNNGSSISDNSATYDGGGIYSSFSSTITLNGGSITGNTAETGTGGGIYTDSTSTINQSGGTVSGNTPDNISYEFDVTYQGTVVGTIAIDTEAWAYVVNVNGLAPDTPYWLAVEGRAGLIASETTNSTGGLRLEGVLNPAPNLRPGSSVFFVGTGSPPPSLGTVELDANECRSSGTTVFGTLTSDGAPVSGQTVEIYLYDPVALEVIYPPAKTTTTDSHGKFCKVSVGGHVGYPLAVYSDGVWDMNVEKASICPIC